MSNRQRQHDGAKQESSTPTASKKVTLPKKGWPAHFKHGTHNFSVHRGVTVLLCLGMGVILWSICTWSSVTFQAPMTLGVPLAIARPSRGDASSTYSKTKEFVAATVTTFPAETLDTILEDTAVLRPLLAGTSTTDNSSRMIASAKSLPGHFFVGIISHLGNADRRDVVRMSWMKHPLVQGGVYNVRFFVALDYSSRYKERIPATEAEAKEHHDMVAFEARKGMDGYTGLIWKTIEMLKYFVSHAEQEGWTYFMKLDDTTYPRLGRLYTNLVLPLYSKRICDPGEIYAGWAIDDRSPRYMNGPGYVLSRKLAEAIVGPVVDLTSTWRLSTSPSQCLDNKVAEDCWMGTWVANASRLYNIRVTHVDLAGRGNNTPHQGCDAHLVFHWDTSVFGMRCMWQEEFNRLVAVGEPYADVGNICSKCFTIAKISPGDYGLKTIPEVGLVPNGVFFGCSKVGMSCINPLTRPPATPNGSCGHEYGFIASSGRYEFTATPTVDGWVMMGRIGCGQQVDSFAGAIIPSFKNCQDVCTAISFCTSMEYDSFTGSCRLFATKVCHPSLGRILQANETFWYLPMRNSIFVSPWKKMDMHDSHVSSTKATRMTINCPSSSVSSGELSARHGLQLAVCQWLCITTGKCTFIVWHSEDAQNISSRGTCHIFEESGCAVVVKGQSAVVALRFVPAALTELQTLISRSSGTWMSEHVLGENVSHLANLRSIELETEQMVLPAPHWRDAQRNREIEECVLSGSVQDMTTYIPVGFTNFVSFEATIFDCAKRCATSANASSLPCVKFSYESTRGTCHLHQSGADLAFSAAFVTGSSHLKPSDCMNAASLLSEGKRSSHMENDIPYELQKSGGALDDCVFREVPSLLRGPFNTPQLVSEASGSQRVLAVLSASDPKHIRPIGRQARVFYWGCMEGCQGGLDHQMWVLYHLLAIATALHASLAVYGPQYMLTKEHGKPVAAANWWSSYFTSDPPIHRMEEVRCSTNSAYSFGSRDQDGFWKMLGMDGPDLLEDAVDPDAPVCLTMNGGWYTLQSALNSRSAFSGTRFTRDLLRLGLTKISFSPSGEVVELARQVVARTPQLQQGYGMVHVRRGDKGAPGCTSVHHVLSKIQKLAEVIGDGFPSRPTVWIVMSNADESWFRDLRDGAIANNTNIITEYELPVLADLADNFMRYAVLQQLYGNASRVLYTYKPLRLRPNRPEQVFLAQRLCRDFDEPALPFSGGGKTLKMNTSSC